MAGRPGSSMPQALQSPREEHALLFSVHASTRCYKTQQGMPCQHRGGRMRTTVAWTINCSRRATLFSSPLMGVLLRMWISVEGRRLTFNARGRRAGVHATLARACGRASLVQLTLFSPYVTERVRTWVWLVFRPSLRRAAVEWRPRDCLFSRRSNRSLCATTYI